MKKIDNESAQRVGTKKIGISEIAGLAKVSIGTVDRALHDRKRISEATRTRILNIAKRVGYTPNLAARTLSVGRASIRIGVCIPQELHYFFDHLRDGILNEGRRFGSVGVEVLYRPFEKLGVGECECVKEVLNTGVRGVIITPGDPHCLQPLIDEAERRNIRVICVASDAPGSSRSSVVCVEPELNGRLAAELMSLCVAPRAKVAIVTGTLCTDDHRKKTDGFCAAFRQYCNGGDIIEVIEGHEDDDETFQKCLDLLKRAPDVAGLYVNIARCLPVCFSLRARGLAGKVRLIATDLFKEMIPFFEKETIHASIYQRPYVQGQTAVRLIVEHVLHNRPIPINYYLNPAIVMRSNLYLFRETRGQQPSVQDFPATNKESDSSQVLVGRP
jgi:LacI family transcriptional regulator